MTASPLSSGSFCWFECGSTDAERAKAFYSAVFGWNAVDKPMSGGMEGIYTLLRVGDDDVAGLYQLSGPQFEGVPSHWMTYVAVESADTTTARANELGATTVVPPMDVPGVGRIAFLSDPTGARFALFQSGEHSGCGAGGPFGWSELATGDTEVAQEFYTELFGWSAKPGSDLSMPYTEFIHDGRPIGGMMALGEHHGDAPPHWLPYVLVDDCDASSAKVTEHGGHTIVPPTTIPTVGRFSVFIDPTGAALAIIWLDSAHTAGKS